MREALAAGTSEPTMMFTGFRFDMIFAAIFGRIYVQLSRLRFQNEEMMLMAFCHRRQSFRIAMLVELIP